MQAPASLLSLIAFLTTAGATASVANAEELLGVRDDGALLTFDSASPQTPTSVRPVTGLAVGELLLAVDFRPTDGALFGVGSTNRLYRIDPDTGAASAVSGAPFGPPLDGTDFGLSFDSGGGTIRVTSDRGQNLLLDPSTGIVSSVDGSCVYASGDVNDGAAANVAACAWVGTVQSGPKLYGIDLARGLLVKFDSPALGTVRTVGSLGVTGTVAGYTALDVSAETGKAYAILDTGNDIVSRTYSVNLTTGAATQLGSAMPALIRGGAVVPSSPAAPAGTRLVGLVGASDLVTFTTDTPETIVKTTHLSGVPAGASLLGVAIRPADGILYAITTRALYDVDTIGGTAAPVGDGFAITLPDTGVSCDFDPATDVLRIVAANGLNVRVDPVTGAAIDADPASPGFQPDAAPAYVAGDARHGITPSIRAIAFSGHATPGNPSKAYVLDSEGAVLARLGDPADAPDEARDGRLFTIGALAIDGVATLPPNQGLVTTGSRTAYAAIQTGPSTSSLFHVDLGRGTAVAVRSIGSSGLVHGLTLEPTASPPRLNVTKLSFDLDFRKSGKDSLTLKGFLPFVGGGTEGKTVTVDVGGVVREFLIDRKGYGTSAADTFHVGGSSPKGLAFTLKLRKEALVARFADEGMDGTTFARRFPRLLAVTLSIGGNTYRTVVGVAYSAKPGKTGSGVKQ